jgi:hypothetical protein
MQAWSLGQSVTDRLGLVGTVVVEDEVNVQLRGHVLFDGIEEVAKLAGAMPLLSLADDFAGAGVQDG